MICKHCGAENQDGISFCTSCGEEMTQELAQTEPKKKGLPKMNKRSLTIVSAVAAGLVVILVLLALLLGNGAENAAEDLYESVLDYDFEGIVEMLPPAMVSSIKEKLDLKNTELEIIDSKDLSATYIAEIDEAYQNKFGTNRGYIENAAIVYIELLYKGEPLTRDRISVYMVEVDGDWYFDPIFTFEDLDLQ